MLMQNWGWGVGGGGVKTTCVLGDVQVANTLDNNMLEVAHQRLHSVPYYNLQKGFVDL